MTEHEPLISEYSHEKSKPREAEALQTLRKIASVVKPMMRQRNWKVGTLKEFYPEQANLLGLNVNKGQSICLRLRYPSDERQFLPFEDVVDTMLHELCHIVHGPHNEAFHRLWDQLRDEHEALVRKGYTGEGFLGKGQVLGGQRIPMQEARRRARAAAERRKVLTAGSGQKLGGTPISRNQDIRKVIISAIERRNSITEGCASNSAQKDSIIEQASRNGFKTKAEEDDANEQAIAQAYMELVQEEQREKYGRDYIKPSQGFPAGSHGATRAKTELGPPSPPSIPLSTKPIAKEVSSSDHTLPSLIPPTDYVDDSWTCEICTLNNPSDFLCCDACGTERPSVPFSPLDTSRRSLSLQHSPRRLSSLSSSKPPPQSSLKEVSDFRSTRSKQALKNYATWREAEQQKPLGWVCEGCGTFTETQFWSCTMCGKIKSTS